MGVHFGLSSFFKKTINTIKHIGSNVLNKSKQVIQHTASGVQHAAEGVGKLAKQGLAVAEKDIGAVLSGAKDIIETPAKLFGNFLNSPMLLIAIAVGGVAAIILLPKLIK